MLKTTEIIRYVFKWRTLHIMAAHGQTLVTIFVHGGGIHSPLWFACIFFWSASSTILKNPGIQPTYNLVFKLYWKIVNIIWIIIPSRVWIPDLVRLTRCQRDLSRRPGIFFMRLYFWSTRHKLILLVRFLLGDPWATGRGRHGTILNLIS